MARMPRRRQVKTAVIEEDLRPRVLSASIDLRGGKKISLSCGHELIGDSLPIPGPLVGKPFTCRKCK